jgi:hypothetical protein
MLVFYTLFLSFVINLMIWTENKKIRIVIGLWATLVFILYILEV